MAIRYEDILEDWKYLWGICEPYDMTGGYVDQDDLETLLLSPSKRTAVVCLENQIHYWFQVGPADSSSSDSSPTETEKRQVAKEHPHVIEIGERYGCDLSLWQ